MKFTSFAFFALAFACSPRAPRSQTPIAPPPAPTSARPAPRLVLWLTVDQLGSNVLERQARHLPGSALGRLFDEGLWFSEAAYGHAVTETAPGHATLFTGAPPCIHGIVGNEWYDRAAKRLTISVYDSEAPLVGPGAPATQKPDAGRSPRLLRAPTIGDALHQAHGPAARVVSISIKDRAAILSAGRSGEAYWLGPDGWVTSTYYAKKAPVWLERAAAEKPVESYVKDGWPLLLAVDQYSAKPAASSYAPHWGPGFPHRPPESTSAREALKLSPFGDRAAFDLGRAALVSERLGEDDIVDLLAISLSATDYVGHYYGLDSLEAEDSFVRLNDELGSFLRFVEEKVGKERLLVVLSADHGGSESAEALSQLGLPGRRLTIAALTEAAQGALVAQSGSKEWLSAVVPPYVVLDRAAISARGKEFNEMRAAVRAALEHVAGVHSVAVVGEPSDDGELGRRISESIFPGRSGDLYVVPDPHTLLLQEDVLGATHGSPWSYDSRVPILLRGASVPSGRVRRPVAVASLAPTVARLLGVSPPAGATRTLLTEALVP